MVHQVNFVSVVSGCCTSAGASRAATSSGLSPPSYSVQDSSFDSCLLGAGLLLVGSEVSGGCFMMSGRRQRCKAWQVM